MKSRPLPAFENSVFINCPFDSGYQDLMLAIVFSVAAHGFVPRSARETEGDPEPRFSRILTTIARLKYSIHDLSRSTGEGGDNLARFNMPLELGMAAAFRLSGRAQVDNGTNGSLSYRKAMPIKDSSLILLVSILPDTTLRCPR